MIALFEQARRQDARQCPPAVQTRSEHFAIGEAAGGDWPRSRQACGLHATLGPGVDWRSRSCGSGRQMRGVDQRPSPGARGLPERGAAAFAPTPRRSTPRDGWRELLHHGHAITDGPCHARSSTAGPAKEDAQGRGGGEWPSRPPRTVLPGARHLDFLRSTQRCIMAPRISGFWPVGFIWNSLDSLVRNEPFQWVTSDLGPILFFGGPCPPNARHNGPPSIRRLTALKRLAGRKGPGVPGIMAVDIARSDRGIGIRLAPPSLFGKEMLIWRHFIQEFQRGSLCRLGRRMHVFLTNSRARRQFGA